MRRSAVLVVAAVLAFAATAHAQGGGLASKIIIQTAKNGLRIASSSSIAEVVRQSRYVNGGKGSETAFVLAQKQEGGSTAVSFVTNTTRAVFPTEVQSLEPNVAGDLEGFVGSPWREVPRETLEREVACGSSVEWCTLSSSYQYKLSAEDVRRLLQQKEKKIRISPSTMGTQFTIPKDHLVATLEALGVLDEFR